MTHRVLLVEDEANYRQVLELMVADLGIDLICAEDGAHALARIDEDELDLVLTDLNMPRMDGLTLLAELKQRRPGLPVVVITAYGTIESAVEAMRRGAIDFLQKPFDQAQLALVLSRALRVTDLMAENRRLRGAVEARYDFSQIVGESAAMIEALRVAGQVAASDATVLVEGESGTGKELLARAIHFNSRRAAGPFVAVNCAALPDTLLEAELFGAEAGAYTGALKRRRGRVELARGGTLFLDEIGDMPLPLQAKILRLIQEKTFAPLGAEVELKADLRFILATHRNLKERVAAGSFREDLYYRVSGLPVRLPALRKRDGDVLLLAEAFARRASESMGRAPMTLAPSARSALLGYSFPGNVRELANIIERVVLTCEGAEMHASDLALPPDESRARRPAARALVLPEDGLVLEEVERDLVRQALERARGNKSHAARLLGLTRATLRYRIDKLKLDGT